VIENLKKLGPSLPETQRSPVLHLTLWPNRSLTEKKFYIVILVLFLTMLIPIAPFLGTTSLNAILPFSILTISLLYILVRLNYRGAKIREDIKIWPNLIEIKRYEADGTKKEWRANPFWTKINIYTESQKIENYLTLKESGREIELGSFLAPNERLEVKKKIETTISNMY
jgi:uncharacterized membrane protein